MRSVEEQALHTHMLLPEVKDDSKYLLCPMPGTLISCGEDILLILLRSQLNAIIYLSFKRYFENDHSKLRILVDSRLENQRIWRFVLYSTIPSHSSLLWQDDDAVTRDS